MKRFTNKDRTAGIRLDVEEFDGIDNDIRGSLIGAKMQSALWKLAALEDIEEELGFSLETRHKVEMAIFADQSRPIWFKSNSGELMKTRWYKFYPAEIAVFDRGPENSTFRLMYRDYGKGWALTKDELE